MEWENIENNHVADIADRLSERTLALEEAVQPLTVDYDWQEHLHDHGLAFMEVMVLRIHKIADDLAASLEGGREIDDEEEDED
jgi:hypothetical protein